MNIFRTLSATVISIDPVRPSPLIAVVVIEQWIERPIRY